MCIISGLQERGICCQLVIPVPPLGQHGIRSLEQLYFLFFSGT